MQQNHFSSLANEDVKFHIQAFYELYEMLKVQGVESDITNIGLFRLSWVFFSLGENGNNLALIIQYYAPSFILPLVW